MGRFLASYLAGILVIAGGWFGWTSADRVAAAVGAAADLIAPSPSHDSPDRDRAAPPTADTDAWEYYTDPETHGPQLDGVTLP